MRFLRKVGKKDVEYIQPDHREDKLWCQSILVFCDIYVLGLAILNGGRGTTKGTYFIMLEYGLYSVKSIPTNSSVLDSPSLWNTRKLQRLLSSNLDVHHYIMSSGTWFEMIYL